MMRKKKMGYSELLPLLEPPTAVKPCKVCKGLPAVRMTELPHGASEWQAICEGCGHQVTVMPAEQKCFPQGDERLREIMKHLTELRRACNEAN